MKNGDISNRSSGAVVIRVEDTLFTPNELKYFRLKHLISRFTPYSMDTEQYLNSATVRLLSSVIQHSDYNCYLLMGENYAYRREFMTLYKEFLEDILHVPIHEFNDKRSVFTNDLDNLLTATGAILYVDEDASRRGSVNQVTSSDVSSAFSLVGARRR